MPSYVFEVDREIDCCFDCPMLFNAFCELAGRDNWDEKGVIPSWCPLEPIEPTSCVNDACCEEMCEEHGRTCYGAMRAAT